MKVWAVVNVVDHQCGEEGIVALFTTEEKARAWIAARVAARHPHWRAVFSARGLDSLWFVKEISLDPEPPAPWRQPVEHVLGEN